MPSPPLAARSSVCSEKRNVECCCSNCPLNCVVPNAVGVVHICRPLVIHGPFLPVLGTCHFPAPAVFCSTVPPPRLPHCHLPCPVHCHFRMPDHFCLAIFSQLLRVSTGKFQSLEENLWRRFAFVLVVLFSVEWEQFQQQSSK